ncbi:MAG TPA: TlpA disulfide reductase family protein [Chitinophagaceae bacterium]|jgi:peroxiredoxin|nr:TlpA disulfide reductase family protein [Chitinophagaceae bacterium]
MRIILFAAFLLITRLSFAQSSREKMDSFFCPSGYAAIDHPYLEFRLTNANTTVDNQSLKGKVVFINFWFEGCHPCVAEMEALNELFNKLKDNKDFVFISLTRDNQETIKRVTEKYALDFEVFSTSNEECRRLLFNCGYPTSIILDKTGILRYKHGGGSTKKEEAREFIMTELLSKIQAML